MGQAAPGGTGHITRTDAQVSRVCRYSACMRTFSPRRDHQVYCSEDCRKRAYLEKKHQHQMRGRVSGIRLLANGRASVSIQVEACDRERISRLSLSDTVLLEEATDEH